MSDFSVETRPEETKLLGERCANVVFQRRIATMKLADFATQFEELGLNLSAYGGAAYYGACEEWSLALQPYRGERINHAKLAISVSSARKSPEVVDRFLQAAEIEKTPQIEQALEAGNEFRSVVGEKQVSFSAVGPDLVVNVIE